MKKFILILTNSFLVSFLIFGQEKYTKFAIPNTDSENVTHKLLENDCESCNKALSPELSRKYLYYKQSNLRDWLYQYFKSTEDQRRSMKSNESTNANLSAVINAIPIKFGYKSEESNEYNYWNKKYTEWVNTRQISIDDIIYLFKQDSEDQLNAWLQCKKISCSSAANYANDKIFIEINKIREGKYDISLINLSIANIKITEIQIDKTLKQESGDKFNSGKKVSNNGGKILATFSSLSTLDENFSINISYKILGTNNINTVSGTYKKMQTLPEVPIGTIISTTLEYEQFLKINQLDNMSSSEQKWMPCDGRPVPNGIYISKTPDLRGLFLRGANVMDKNQNLHTSPVSDKQKNPEEPEWGQFQLDGFGSHSHLLFTTTNPEPNADNGNIQGDSNSYASVRTIIGGSWSNYNIVKSGNREALPTIHKSKASGIEETRPKNISIIYLIKVR